MYDCSKELKRLHIYIKFATTLKVSCSLSECVRERRFFCCCSTSRFHALKHEQEQSMRPKETRNSHPHLRPRCQTQPRSGGASEGGGGGAGMAAAAQGGERRFTNTANENNKSLPLQT
jgi:hypothetical protein